MDNAIGLSGEDHLKKKKITSSSLMWLKSDYVQTLQERTMLRVRNESMEMELYVWLGLVGFCGPFM